MVVALALKYPHQPFLNPILNDFQIIVNNQLTRLTIYNLFGN